MSSILKVEIGDKNTDSPKGDNFSKLANIATFFKKTARI